MSEIDRFMKRVGGYGSTRVGAAYAAQLAKTLSAEQARELLTSKVGAVLAALFDDRAPWEAVTAICGRTPVYWEESLRPGRERKRAVEELLVGLRAHVAGVRDHLNDVEKTVVDCSHLIDQLGSMGKR